MSKKNQRPKPLMEGQIRKGGLNPQSDTPRPNVRIVPQGKGPTAKTTKFDPAKKLLTEEG